MIVSNWAVKNRTAVLVFAVIILIFGMYCYKSLPRESEPDITIPNVFVSTDYRGVSAGEIETSITIEIEDKLKGLEGVKKIHSISSEGLSSINIEFVTGTDIDDVLQKVRDKVDEAKKELPGDLEDDPKVFEVNFSEMPVVVFTLSGTCGLSCLTDLAEDLEREIEAVAGVLDVELSGEVEREVRVEVVPDKLAYYGVSIDRLRSVIAGENQNTSGGIIKLGDGRFQLRVPGEFANPSEIFNLVVAEHQGEPVYLKDLAQVVDGFKERTSRARLNGMEAVSLSVKKRAGENVIAITDRVDEIIAENEPRWPKGTEIIKLMDKAKEIRANVADLENNMLSGLVLVIAVLFFALGLRNAFLVSLAIPFSMMLSFIVLYAMGITLNMVVLFSLTLALGMLVDNAIVIVENIYRHHEQGAPKVRAAVSGSSEVAWPIIGSTTTTLAAFGPMLGWPGIMGEFMKYLPITLIITLSSSLFVALVINPALCAFFIRTPNGGKAPTAEDPADKDDVLDIAAEEPVEIRGPVLTTYNRLIRAALNHRLVVLAMSFLTLFLLVQVWLLVVGIEKPVEFFPEIDPKSMYVNIDTPEGASLEYVDSLVREVEWAITGASEDDGQEGQYRFMEHRKLTGETFMGPSDLVNVEEIYGRSTVMTGGGMAFDPRAPNHVAVQFLELQERTGSSFEDMDLIRERVTGIPGAKITVAAAEEGPPTGAPINIEISGENFAVLGALANQIRQKIEGVPHVHDIRDDYVEGTPTVRVSVDRQKAAVLGLSTDIIGYALKAGYNGLIVSSYREADETFDITVQLPESDRRATDVLRELLLPSQAAGLVPLTTVANIDYTGGIGDVVRIDHRRTVTVKANVDETKIPGPVARQQAEKMLKDLSLPPGYGAKFTGEFEFQKESEEFLTRAFIVAVFLILLVLVTQFNSVVQPFIIITSVILSFGGAFLGLTVLKLPFGIIMTGVGVISLAGVVVNNAIVLIDYINRLARKGLDLKEAIVLGGATRLRPVLLTAITTILGLIPMVTGISYDFHNWAISWVSESSQWWRSMAIVVIFGLMTATFLTLVVVPVLYSLFNNISKDIVLAINWLRRLYWRPYHWLTRK